MRKEILKNRLDIGFYIIINNIRKQKRSKNEHKL